MKVAEKLGRRSTDEFKLGDQVLAQNMKTLKWTIRGQVVDCRTADDGSTLLLWSRLTLVGPPLGTAGT